MVPTRTGKKRESSFQSEKSQGILLRLDKTGKSGNFTQNTEKYIRKG